MMIWQSLLGATSFLTGIILMVLGTDYGRVMEVTPLLLLGSIMVILGMARMKHAWLQRKAYKESQKINDK